MLNWYEEGMLSLLLINKSTCSCGNETVWSKRSSVVRVWNVQVLCFPSVTTCAGGLWPVKQSLPCFLFVYCFLRVLRPSFKRLSVFWPGKNWSNQNSDERGGNPRKRLLRRLGDVCSGGGGTQTSFHGKTCHVAKLALVNLTLTRFNLWRITCSPFTHEQLKLNKQNLFVWDRQEVSSAVT